MVAYNYRNLKSIVKIGKTLANLSNLPKVFYHQGFLAYGIPILIVTIVIFTLSILSLSPTFIYILLKRLAIYYDSVTMYVTICICAYCLLHAGC